MSCLSNAPWFFCRRRKHKRYNHQSNTFTKTSDPKPKRKSPVNDKVKQQTEDHELQNIKIKPTDITFSYSHSQSDNTKATSAVDSILSNSVPLEISVGGVSFDKYDEVSVMSCSTLRNPVLFKNEICNNQRKKYGASFRNDNLHQNKQFEGTHVVNQNSIEKGKTNFNDSEELENETTSHYTRISI